MYFFKYCLLTFGFLLIIPFAKCRHQDPRTKVQSKSVSSSLIEQRARGFVKGALQSGGNKLNSKALGFVAGNGEAFGSVSNKRGSIGVNVRRRGQSSRAGFQNRRWDRQQNTGRISQSRNGLGSSLSSRSNSHFDPRQSPSRHGNFNNANAFHGQDVMIVPRNRGSNPQSSRSTSGHAVNRHSSRATGHAFDRHASRATPGHGVDRHSSRAVSGHRPVDLLPNSDPRGTLDRSGTKIRINSIFSQNSSPAGQLSSRPRDGMVAIPLSLVRALLRRLRSEKQLQSLNSPFTPLNSGRSPRIPALSALLNSRHFEIERKEPKILPPSLRETLLPREIAEESLLFLSPLLQQLTSKFQNLGNLFSNQLPSISGVPKGTGSGGISQMDLLTLGLLDFPELEVFEELLKDMPEKKKSKRRKKNRRQNPKTVKKTQTTNTKITTTPTSVVK